MKITVESRVMAPLEAVWQAWVTPADIVQWNAASEDWHTPSAEVDLRVGGSFRSRMEARDGSAGFDFEGRFTSVEPLSLIEYEMSDGRRVSVSFEADGGVTTVRETFDAESMHDPEFQRQGWQAILDNFARYVESKL